MKKRLLVLLVAVAMIAVPLAACGGGGDSSSAEKQLVVQVGPNPETLDPALNSAVDGANTILHLFEGLLVVDENSQLAPGQAESWETSEDGLTWTFHLRDGLKWSDGTDITANDFVYSWKRIADPELAAPYLDTVLNPIKGYNPEGTNPDDLAISAPDDKTLVVELNAPCTFFGSLAAFATMMPVQQATIEANGDAWATSPDTYVSNGPFYMTEWEQGSHITVSKNPNYWNADAIKLDSIKFMLIEDPNAAYSAYQNGEVDFIKDVPTEEIPSLEGNDEFHVDPSGFPCSWSVGSDHHAFNALGVAGRSKFLSSFNFYNAYSACAYVVYTFKITEMRDLDADLISCFHDGSAFRHSDLLSVYGYVYHLSSLPPLKEP